MYSVSIIISDLCELAPKCYYFLMKDSKFIKEDRLHVTFAYYSFQHAHIYTKQRISFRNDTHWDLKMLETSLKYFPYGLVR